MTWLFRKLHKFHVGTFFYLQSTRAKIKSCLTTSLHGSSRYQCLDLGKISSLMDTHFLLQSNNVHKCNFELSF